MSRALRYEAMLLVRRGQLGLILRESVPLTALGALQCKCVVESWSVKEMFKSPVMVETRDMLNNLRPPLVTFVAKNRGVAAAPKSSGGWCIFELLTCVTRKLLKTTRF